MNAAVVRILIVDDDPDIRFVLGNILLLKNFEVIYAESGAEAIKIIAEHKLDAILCDHMMPEVSGIDVLAEVNGTQNHTPFILITGHSDPSVVRAALRLGAFDFIDKPFSSDEILQVVQRAIEVGDRRLRMLQPA